MLSKRLQAVAEEIPPGSVVADIGSDHAQLPCDVCLHGIATRAIAGEVAAGPLASAYAQVEKQGLERMVSVRQGNGLEVIHPGEVDVIVMAGMGGILIRDILRDGEKKLTGVSKLILQPNVRQMTVRRWLMQHHWELTAEKILEEDGKIYEIMMASPGDGRLPYQRSGEMGLWAGPFLMKEKNPIFLKKWRKERKKWEEICAGLDKKDPSENVINIKREGLKKIKDIGEMLGESSVGRPKIGQRL